MPRARRNWDNFIDPESKYPVLVTTSRLLSTGVDVQTCRLIVLDREVGSMTEFKQILGRGTRVHEDTRKLYFTLMDFRGATNHFADPEFDGEPVQIYEPGEDDRHHAAERGCIRRRNRTDGDETTDDVLPDPPPDSGRSHKVYVDGVRASIVAGARFPMWISTASSSPNPCVTSPGKLSRNASPAWTTSSGAGRPPSASRPLSMSWQPRVWSSTRLPRELNKDLDPFDLICHVAFDARPLTRRERAANVKKRDVFHKYGDKARAVLDALLAKYADEGVFNLDDVTVLRIPPLTELGTPVQLLTCLRGQGGFR